MIKSSVAVRYIKNVNKFVIIHTFFQTLFTQEADHEIGQVKYSPIEFLQYTPMRLLL